MNSETEKIKVALVHDFLNQYGGAERVLEVMSEMFPEAPIYTLLYDPAKMRGKFKGKKIHTSFLQKFPHFFRKRTRWFLPFLPVAPETFDLRDFDLVISSSGAWTKGIITRLNTIHIAYIHSPMRFVWDYNESYLKDDRKEKIAFLIRPVLNYLRIWDRAAADRPDHLIANSNYTKERIRKYYRRDSVVIYPPAFVPQSGTSAGKPALIQQGEASSYAKASEDKSADKPASGESQNDEDNDKKYFLIVSRLSAYKKIEPVIESFNKLGLPLVVAGEGNQEKYLRKIAGKNIKILGWQPDKKLEELYRGARAFLFPGVDDFGIAPVEAMSRGIPVLAIRKGGAKEIVEEGKTGEFFDAATPEVIADCVRRFIGKEGEYDRKYIIDQAERFSKERFIREFREYIARIIPNH